MTHHNAKAATPHRCTEEKKTTTPRAPKEVLLSLDVFFNRDELVTMNRFLSRHAYSVRIVGADGEHHVLDPFQARRFLSTVRKSSRSRRCCARLARTAKTPSCKHDGEGG